MEQVFQPAIGPSFPGSREENRVRERDAICLPKSKPITVDSELMIFSIKAKNS